MKRYILTGTPGAGKTTLLRALSHKELSVVEEAATDIIQQEQALGVSEPWLELNFIPKVLEVQKYRQSLTNTPSNSVQFYDRSPICTYALCLFLQRPIPTSLQNEVDRIISKKFYETDVFFIQNLGVIENTPVRQINLEHALEFEQLHAQVYAKFGYTLIKIPMASVEERIKLILEYVQNHPHAH